MLKTTTALIALALIAGFESIRTTVPNEDARSLDRAVTARMHQRRTTERFFERAAPALPNTNSTPRNPATPETQVHRHHNHLV